LTIDYLGRKDHGHGCALGPATIGYLILKEQEDEKHFTSLPLHELAHSIRKIGAGTGTGTGLSHCKTRSKNFFIFFGFISKKLAHFILCR
jgi:hypothetical protein